MPIRLEVPTKETEGIDRVWIPHPGPQTELLTRTEDEMLYGGARGGGKSDGGRMWLLDQTDNPLFRALVVRKNAGDLDDWVDKARYWFGPMGATFAYKPSVITWPSGAKIITGHLKDADAYTKYQGQEFQRMLIEEATQIPDLKRYVQLIGSCRSTVPGIRPQVLLTANPGNIGHQWVKARFIDPAIPGNPFKDGTGRSFVFIPSTVDDNPTLSKNDPGYLRYLDSIKETDENLWRAWRYGDWSIFVGQVFSKFRPATHVISRLPDNVKLSQCKKIVGFDWGYNAPGAAVFIAVTPKNRWGVKHYYQYRELYLTKNDPAEWASRLAELNEMDKIDWMVLPHDCYSEAQGHKSIEKVFKEYMPSLNFIRGKTLSKGARHQRVAIMQWCLSADENEPAGDPRFQILARCTDMIRTLPNLVYDENDIEDIDTDGEDHLFDAASLALMTEISDAPAGRVIQTNPSGVFKPTESFALSRDGLTVPRDALEELRESLPTYGN
jgi:hypothetical protein